MLDDVLVRLFIRPISRLNVRRIGWRGSRSGIGNGNEEDREESEELENRNHGEMKIGMPASKSSANWNGSRGEQGDLTSLLIYPSNNALPPIGHRLFPGMFIFVNVYINLAMRALLGCVSTGEF